MLRGLHIAHFMIFFILIIFFNNLMSEKTMNDQNQFPNQARKDEIKLFLCGDVMTGRGVDQILPQSVDPQLYESYVKDARDYVLLAEGENGSISQPVSYDYIWGDALEIWKQANPDFRIINLETSVTTHDEPWPAKTVNYRMHPDNVKVLATAKTDFCSLANNHSMDWGIAGLLETMETLEEAEIPYGGAGRNLQRASQPVILNMGENRVIMVCYGSETSGIPASWEATGERSGLNLIRAPNKKHIAGIAKQILSLKQKGDIVVFSIHWGSNWGYHIPERQKEFARLLIDEAGVDLVHGHSSHHPIGIEVYQDKLILYGAGDFINDYEGISGYENYRDDLSLMYFPVIDPEDGKLLDMRLYPMQIKNIKLNRASEADAKWLMERLNKEGMKLGTKFILEQDKSISMAWY